MKTLILPLIFVIPSAFAHDSGAGDLTRSLSASHNSYRTAVHVQQMQSSKLSSLMDELYKKTQQSKALGAYNAQAATIKWEMSQLVARINETSAVYQQNNVRVRADSQQVIENAEARRQQYYQRLQAASGLPNESLRTLPAEIRRDIQFFKSISELSPQARHQNMLLYEGTRFGQVVRGDQPGDIELIRGISSRGGEVKIDTYHTTRNFHVAQNQIIQLYTVDGAVVRGRVMGVMPDGRVLIAPILPGSMTSYVPDTAKGRLINLSEAKSLSIYADIERFNSGKPDLELDVRFGTRQLMQGAKDRTLSLSAMRQPINGSYATRHQVTATSIDRRGGEMINNLNGLHDTMGLGIH